MTKRNVWKVFWLGIVTLGVYFFVWHFKFQNELREECGKGILPSGHILIMFLPVANIIYYIYYRMVVEGRLVLVGATGKNRWWLHLILIVSVVGALFIPTILQSKANTIGLSDGKQQTMQDKILDKYARYNIK